MPGVLIGDGEGGNGPINGLLCLQILQQPGKKVDKGDGTNGHPKQ
jgi:hypothetical protein